MLIYDGKFIRTRKSIISLFFFFKIPEIGELIESSLTVLQAELSVIQLL